jgi:hypothetical protein
MRIIHYILITFFVSSLCAKDQSLWVLVQDKERSNFIDRAEGKEFHVESTVRGSFVFCLFDPVSKQFFNQELPRLYRLEPGVSIRVELAEKKGDYNLLFAFYPIEDSSLESVKKLMRLADEKRGDDQVQKMVARKLYTSLQSLCSTKSSQSYGSTVDRVPIGGAIRGMDDNSWKIEARKFELTENEPFAKELAY